MRTREEIENYKSAYILSFSSSESIVIELLLDIRDLLTPKQTGPCMDCAMNLLGCPKHGSKPIKEECRCIPGLKCDACCRRDAPPKEEKHENKGKVELPEEFPGTPDGLIDTREYAINQIIRYLKSKE